MLKRLRAKHPVGFCVLSEVLFLGSLLLASYLIVFALVLFGVDLERVDSYFLSAVQEAVGMVVALVILGRTGKMYLLRRRGSGFFNGLLVGMYPLVLIGYSLYTKLMFGMPEDGQLQPAFSIFSFFLSMALVGVAEEFIFRGVIAQSLLERFGTGRAGVWKACLLSGLLFGAAHLTNLLSSAPFGVLMQCVFAASLGTLFAAIYFRTGAAQQSLPPGAAQQQPSRPCPHQLLYKAEKVFIQTGKICPGRHQRDGQHQTGQKQGAEEQYLGKDAIQNGVSCAQTFEHESASCVT